MMPASRPFLAATTALALLLPTAGCTPKEQPTTDDTGGATDDTAGDTAVEEVEPVWEDLRLETSDTLTGCYASGAGLYVVTQDGDSWVRQGGAWSALDIDTGGEALNGLWGSGSGGELVMQAVGDAGVVAAFADGAWTVDDIGTANLESVSGNAADDLVAVGWGGVYTLGADGWTFTALDGNPKFNHVWYSGNLAVAVGEDGAIGTMTDGAWTVTEEGDRRRLYGVDGTGPTDIWAVGERGTVLHFDGAAWTAQEVDVEVSLWAVEALSPTDVYVVGDNGTALHYDGSAWTELPTGVINNLYAVSGVVGGAVWAVGNRGITLRYTP